MNIRAASYARICVPARSTTDSERTIMLHVFTLLSVPEYSADALVRSIRQGGEWHAIARHLLPELIATDLLEHRASDIPPFLSSSQRLYLAQDFWTSSDAYQIGRASCREIV